MHGPRRTLDPETERLIIEKVCDAHRADNLWPDEVSVNANGEIWIDRSSRDRRNVPFLVGRWS